MDHHHGGSQQQPQPSMKPAFDAVAMSFATAQQLHQQTPQQQLGNEANSASSYCPRTPYSVVFVPPPLPPPPLPPQSLPILARPLSSLAVSLFTREIRPKLTELAEGKGDCRKKSLYFPCFAANDYFELFPWATCERSGRYFTATAGSIEAVNFLFQNNHGAKRLAKVFRNKRYARIEKLSFCYDLFNEKLSLHLEYNVFEPNGQLVTWAQRYQHELQVTPGLALFRQIKGSNQSQ